MIDQASYDSLINLLGVTGNLVPVKNPAVNNIKMGFATASKEDMVVLNSIGFGAKIITIKASSVSIAPVKFDAIHIGTERYVIDSVNPSHIPGGKVVGYKCYCKGH
jgi:hypothetical protein